MTHGTAGPDRGRPGPATRPTVLKFGGTSVEDAAALERLAAIVGRQADRAPVVVVSAMRGVTDTLLHAVRLASLAQPAEGEAALAEQLVRYAAAAEVLLPAGGALPVRQAVEAAVQEISHLLRVVANHPGTRLPLQDEIVSYGERLSANLAAAVLRGHGLPGQEVDARRCILTTEEHARAAPLLAGTGERTRAELAPRLAAGEIPVLGGFVGAAESGATTTLGRGGSDYSAALLGAVLDAREIQIWTDVTGFLTADPRVVPAAAPIEHLSYAEAAELAYFGAKVLHPKTIQPAVERAIPVRICNSRLPDAPGTLIDERAEPSPVGCKAIAHKRGITVVQVSSARMLGAYGFLRAIFEVFDRFRTEVDVVATSEVSVSLSLDDTRSLPAIVEELERLGTVRVHDGRAIVCVVGEGLAYRSGMAARIFGTIADINILMISQGASNINVTFMVREEEVGEVVARLHRAFFE
jgi:aspartate kinase